MALGLPGTSSQDKKGYFFGGGGKILEIGEAEKCPNPREPLSGTPTAQIGGMEMIVLCFPNTVPCSFDAHFKDKEIISDL